MRSYQASAELLMTLGGCFTKHVKASCVSGLTRSCTVRNKTWLGPILFPRLEAPRATSVKGYP